MNLWLLSFEWPVDRYTYRVGLSASTQISNITQYYYSVFSSPFTWYGCCQSPQNTLSTRIIIIQPRYIFSRRRRCRCLLTIDFNFIIETYYNIQYYHANDISSLTLSLSSSHSHSTPVFSAHSSFNLFGESESNFF